MAPKKRVRKIPSLVDSEPLMLTIQGYKSIAKRLTLPIKPLTVLSGSNSSGKSSFMQPLLLMKQTLEAPFDPGPLLINGPNIRFTTASQFLSATDKPSVPSDLYVALGHGGQSTEVHFHKSGDQPIDLKSQTVRDAKSAETFVPGAEFTLSDLPQIVRSNLGLYTRLIKDQNLVAIRNRCFLELGIKFGGSNSDAISLGIPRQLSGDFPEVLSSLMHLPGLRGNPSRTYQISTVGSTYPGPFQNYAASLISHWGDKQSKELTTLNTYLQELQIATRISAKKVDETQVELRVDRLESSNDSSVSIADVGMAVSQILPVLVALAEAKRNQMIFIEQPELHLHPKAQFALARILCGAVERGIRLVVETHSSLLLLGIQTCIAEKVVEHNNVALHWFRKDDQGVTCVDSATLDATGSFGKWPQDFADVSLEAQDQYLSAVESASYR